VAHPNFFFWLRHWLVAYVMCYLGVLGLESGSGTVIVFGCVEFLSLGIVRQGYAFGFLLHLYTLASLFRKGWNFGWEMFRLYAAPVVFLFPSLSSSRLVCSRC